MMANPTSFTRTGGLQCNKDTLRNALNKANYDFAQKYPASDGQCGYDDNLRKLDSEEESDSDMVDWNAINADNCANDPLPILCFESVNMRDELSVELYTIENADTVLCCWQMGMPPEDYYLAPASWYLEGSKADEGIGREGEDWNPYTTTGVGNFFRKLATESDLVIKARSSQAETSSRSKAARTLETKESLKNNRWTLPHWSRSKSLVASLRQLRGDTEGNRRLSSDSDDPADVDSEDGDHDPTPSEGPIGTIFNGFLSGPGNNDYDCNNHYQVRSDILTVLDQSPWFYDSFCYVFAAASLGQDPFLSSSTSTFMSFPKSRDEKAPSNVYANPMFNRRIPKRKLGLSESKVTFQDEFHMSDFSIRPPNAMAGISDQCRQAPLYPTQYVNSPNHVGIYASEPIALCGDGYRLRADRSWATAMLTMNGPMKCCLDSLMKLSSDYQAEGSEVM